MNTSYALSKSSGFYPNVTATEQDVSVSGSTLFLPFVTALSGFERGLLLFFNLYNYNTIYIINYREYKKSATLIAADFCVFSIMVLTGAYLKRICSSFSD